MATKTPQPEAEEKTPLVVPEEIVEQVEKNLERINTKTKKQKGTLSFDQPRTAGRNLAVEGEAFPDPTVPFPEDFNFDGYGPAGFAAVPFGPITGNSETQMFTIDASKVENLWFQKPGLNLPKKRLYTVKAIHTNGTMVQLPFELQINNTAGGDPEDAIGLHRYVRKGIHVLFDFKTMQPVYCAAWGCWAKADGQTGFCSPKHAQHTLPNRYKDAAQIVQGLMEVGATTSRTWGV